MMYRLITVMLPILLAPWSAMAAPINVSEPPELPLNFEDIAPFVLDVGANTISGTMDALDRDAFGFILPADTELTTITFDFDLEPTGLDSFESRFRLCLNNNPNCRDIRLGSFIAVSFDLFGGSSVNAFTAALPLGPGAYAMQSIQNVQFGFGIGQLAEYAWTLNVRSTAAAGVPEPATIVVLDLGLAGLAALRRRK